MRKMYEQESAKEKLIFDENNLKVIGVDVNTSGNLFMCSDGKMFPQNEFFIEKCKNLNDFLMRKLKFNSKLNDDAKLKLQNFSIKAELYLRDNVEKLIQYCLENNYNHIACEDLEIRYNQLDDFYEEDFYNRFAYLIDLNSVKNLIKEIGNKNGIMVSFVDPKFTSQQCPHCGHISRNNRKLQKYFECEYCHDYIGNADLVAAINIRNRISVKKLRDELMYFDVHFNGFRENVLIQKNTYVKLIKEPYLNGVPYEVNSIVNLNLKG